MIRGLFTHADALYQVNDAGLYSIDSLGIGTLRGTLLSTGGIIDFASTLGVLCINDGTNLYTYNPSTLAFAVVASYPGGDRIAFIDQRVLFLYRGTQKYGWTGLNNPNSINVLDFASAEGSPDPIVSMLTPNREVWLFGTSSTEVWNSVGGTEVFQRSRSAAIDFGCAAAHSAQRSANSVTWLSRDERGQAMVLRAAGYQPQRISTRAIEERFEGLDVSGASAYTYSHGGQQFYCLNTPGVPTTLVYDETFQQWHERAELVGGEYAPWRPTCHAFAYGKHWFGDITGALYTLDVNVNNYGGSPKVRERIAPVLSDPSRRRLSFSMLEIVCEKATAATVMLRHSDDNGANWSSWHYANAGAVGQYARKVRFPRLGSSYDRVFQIRMTDDAAFNPVQIAVAVN